MARQPRYRWRGDKPHAEALRILARSRLMVLSSRMEGGANVICEAVMAGTPVLASRVPGNVGMLGNDYQGYFTTGNEHELADLLARAESDAGFLATLARQCAARRPLFAEESEAAALLAALSAAGAD